MVKKTPVEDIVTILEYLHDEEMNYKHSEPSDREGHIYCNIKRVNQWLLEQHPEERTQAIKKLHKKNGIDP